MSDASWQPCPVLGVRDVRAAAEDLVKRFGFDLVNLFEGVDADEGAVYAIVRREGAELHLQIRRRALRSGRERIETDLYLRVDDADRVHAELSERGVRMVQPLRDEPYGQRDFTAEGPEGLRISFGSPLQGPRPHPLRASAERVA